MCYVRSPLRLVLVSVIIASQCLAAVYDVRTHGAKGDGRTLDSPAINRAIEAAAAAGGGTVYLPAGTYLCGSIRLKSNIHLFLEAGATIEATTDPNAYDQAEPNEYGDRYRLPRLWA